MIGRFLTIAILLAAGYWYWSGPYQRQHNPDEAEQLRQAVEAMRECIRGMNYKAGATGVSEGDAQQICAEKFNLYFYEGEWRSSQ
ncbi:MAG: hypothetical protein V2I26_07240 [Halieaceae bacterium]|nr:hypothetical protein [Halieaceae bacterium]